MHWHLYPPRVHPCPDSNMHWKWIKIKHFEIYHFFNLFENKNFQGKKKFNQFLQIGTYLNFRAKNVQDNCYLYSCKMRLFEWSSLQKKISKIFVPWQWCQKLYWISTWLVSRWHLLVSLKLEIWLCLLAPGVLLLPTSAPDASSLHWSMSKSVTLTSNDKKPINLKCFHIKTKFFRVFKKN